MNSQDFPKFSRQAVTRINRYVTDRAPAVIIQKTYRFIDGNFRAQGWQGRVFQRWQKNKRGGTILVMHGHLRRGLNHTGAGPGAVKFYNNRPYSGIHNRGGEIKTTAKVRSHTRRRLRREEVSAPRARKEKWVKLADGTHTVKAHTREMKMTMPQRQFAPYEGNESPVMNNAIQRELERDILNILTLKK